MAVNMSLVAVCSGESQVVVVVAVSSDRSHSSVLSANVDPPDRTLLYTAKSHRNIQRYGRPNYFAKVVMASTVISCQRVLTFIDRGTAQ